jgi:cytosine/adenosine deaminase-related metal-dependent hydrolase
VVAHAVHLAWPELSQLIATGAWIIHNPRSNMDRQVGFAPSGKFGARATIGTNGLSGDVLSDVKLAYFRAREAGQPIDVLRYLANGHRLASQVFNQPIGILEPGAVADLVVLDYSAPTPLQAETLAHHVVLGFGARWVESVMVDGVWRLWARRPLSVAPDQLAARARQKSAELWQRAGIL